MNRIDQKFLTGERVLFQGQNLQITYSTFADGESPLKESRDIEIEHSIFKWKYPLWYSRNIKVKDSMLLETARAGIWYTEDVSMENCVIEAPKTFRRVKNLYLKKVTMTKAEETLWNCENVRLEQVTAKGDYFGMNSKDITIKGFDFVGNYSFDGGKNLKIYNAKMLSKDAFWNCENVTVYDSFISGEYVGWNSRNLTFINCTIESLQGLCYIDNLKMENCRLLNTTQAFEYSNVDVQINGSIDSVMNPASGVIQAGEIKELILEDTKICPENTRIVTVGKTV